MDVEILARSQFALTIMFHYIYPTLSIGLSLMIVIVEGFYLKTRDDRYLHMAKYWTRMFALTFALGVATGIVMEFEFGTNWATYSRYVGDVFGSALAAEGVFAFFLESGFLALLLFGWDRVGPKTHFFASLMVCLGAHFSAIWIVVANSWMQTPAGFEIVGEGLQARAEITSFWAMVFNPSSMVRLAHTVVGAWLAGAFLVKSVAAYYMLKNKYRFFSEYSFKIGLSIAIVATLLQGLLGAMSAEIVTKYQPAKLGAMEGLYVTQAGAPFYIFGIPNDEAMRIDYGLAIPKFLSFLAYGNFDAVVTGLDQFPKKDWPHVAITFQSYRIMIGAWNLMLVLSLWGVFLWWRGKLETSRKTLWCFVFAVALPQIANQLGWVTAETGRYPWIVYNHLRISDGLSKAVSAGQVLGSIITFGIVYLFLFILFIYLLDHKIKHGPTIEEEEEEEIPYHAIRGALEDHGH
ncbi:MAG: cytochrome ubiquinol oxidase subunit I [Chlamydiales bacterium]